MLKVQVVGTVRNGGEVNVLNCTCILESYYRCYNNQVFDRQLLVPIQVKV